MGGEEGLFRELRQKGSTQIRRNKEFRGGKHLLGPVPVGWNRAGRKDIAVNKLSSERNQVGGIVASDVGRAE